MKRLARVAETLFVGIFRPRMAVAVVALFVLATQMPAQQQSATEPRGVCVARWDCERGVRTAPRPSRLDMIRMNELNTYRHAHLENAR